MKRIVRTYPGICFFPGKTTVLSSDPLDYQLIRPHNYKYSRGKNPKENPMSNKSPELSTPNRQAEISQRVHALLMESGNCAQTSFAILCELHELEGAQILKALTPILGITLRGETCGAVIGSLMGLGLVYDREDLADWQGLIYSLPPAGRFCRQFEEENGTPMCNAILQEKLGRNGDDLQWKYPEKLSHGVYWYYHRQPPPKI
jgi:hypothetical protein